MENKKIIIGNSSYSYKTAKMLATISKMFAILLMLIGMMCASVSVLFGIILVTVGIFMFAYSKNLKKIVDNQLKESTMKSVTAEKKVSCGEKRIHNVEETCIRTQSKTVEKNEAEKNYNLFPDFVEDKYLAYEYEENIAIPVLDLIIGNGGRTLEFKKEVNNEYDKNAVAIFLDTQKIGYLYKGKVQDMVNDWIKRDDYFCGHINKVNMEKGYATFKIAFYKEINSLSMNAFKLTKILKKEDEFGSSRFENVGCCMDGDLVSFESSYETDNYVITDESGNELGELGEKASEWITENKEAIKFSRINNIEESDSGNYKATIEFYFKD
ncbi:MAG: hypothetical protein IKU13_05530 [Clostridia bacterium]|nr:hypothetical protein [Clostridia bacterium]